MRARAIIEKKRNGETLTNLDIEYFVRGYMALEITDYQAAALMMAICLRGMSPVETLALTREMRDSGEVMDLSGIPGKKIGKHSTGGVGDKTSLLLAPIVAACGITVPMITGRALGHTGGTVDKLEAIPGFNPMPSPGQVLSLLTGNGAVLMGQTVNLAPADRRLYALRDATATVESIPLITASILSKKLAEGTDGLVLDVKTGSGAFMTTAAMALKLARSLADTCRRMKMRAVILITDMERPLGRAVGNALEVRECMEFFDGQAATDLKTVTLALAAEMIRLGGKAKTGRAAALMVQEALESGAARQRFLEIVAAQGGDIRCLEDSNLLPQARNVTPLKARRTGVLTQLDARLVGNACNALGAGRATMEDPIDPAVGIYLHKAPGEAIRRGEVLCDIHWNDEERLRNAMPLLERAFQFGARPARRRPLIRDVFRG